MTTNAERTETAYEALTPKELKNQTGGNAALWEIARSVADAADNLEAIICRPGGRGMARVTNFGSST